MQWILENWWHTFCTANGCLWRSVTRCYIWSVGIIQLPSKWECSQILVTEQTLSLILMAAELFPPTKYGRHLVKCDIHWLSLISLPFPSNSCLKGLIYIDGSSKGGHHTFMVHGCKHSIAWWCWVHQNHHCLIICKLTVVQCKTWP